MHLHTACAETSRRTAAQSLQHLRWKDLCGFMLSVRLDVHRCSHILSFSIKLAFLQLVSQLQDPLTLTKIGAHRSPGLMFLLTLCCLRAKREVLQFYYCCWGHLNRHTNNSCKLYIETWTWPKKCPKWGRMNQTCWNRFSWNAVKA